MLLLALSLRVLAGFGEPGAPANEPARAASTAQGSSRFIVLGFDGADCRLTTKFLEEGQLPNLAKLRESGSFYPLRTTNPAQSPVSWAAFNTGLGPEHTNIYDFVCRLNEDRSAPADAHGRKPKLPKPLPQIALAYPAPESSDPFLPRPLRSDAWPFVVGGSMAAVFIVFLGLLRFGAKFPWKAASLISVLLAGGSWFALDRVSSWIPRELPVPKSEKRGTDFWHFLDKAGVSTLGLVVPLTFPFKEEELANTKMLAGLGVPDARQSWGDWFVLTEDAQKAETITKGSQMGGEGIVLERDPSRDRGRAKAYKATIEGPTNFWLKDKLDARAKEINDRMATGQTTRDENLSLSAELDAIRQQQKNGLRAEVLMEARVSEDGKRVAIELDHHEITRPDGDDLAAGDWSPRVRASFQLNPLLRLQTLVTFRVLSIQPLEIFLKPLNLDPRTPPPQGALSVPREFSKELATSKVVGDFETLGWACMTNALNDAVIDEETFLQDVERVCEQHEKLLFDRLERNDWRFFFEVFGVTDRVQHLMFRHIDPQHPKHNPAEAAREVTFFGKRMPVKETIVEIYRQMDRIVGEVVRRSASDGKTALMVVSDHGFSSFRRGVWINNWLQQNGYLAISPQALELDAMRMNDLFDSKKLLAGVDWSQTRAYSLGLGKIFLNVKDREPNGIVEEKDREALEREIAQKLEQSLDPKTGKPFIKKAYLAREIYPGHERNDLGAENRDNAEDIVIGFAEGYRVSWGTALGGIRTEVISKEDPSQGSRVAQPFEDNVDRWSGDHCSVDPSLVTGIFFSTLRYKPPTDEPTPDVRHCAPTILQYFGVPVPTGMRPPLQVQ